eukprot:TRINITY_DN38766_c0_g1_i1.p1 TRINITY_DN38766_c0_g1~~TRINITY_DN38766_c0_g1_i1.p1  ORF type:complete len:110 (-),score=24.03 TRINITY_DN38766_c0_g1_i1:30-359(-)
MALVVDDVSATATSPPIKISPRHPPPTLRKARQSVKEESADGVGLIRQSMTRLSGGTTSDLTRKISSFSESDVRDDLDNDDVATRLDFNKVARVLSTAERQFLPPPPPA